MPASVRLGRTIVVLGGVRIDERGNDFLIYDLDTDAWREVPPTSKPSPAAKGR
jgi:hypothetical protein